ncbi:hypothetical protein SI65_01046 [Aspergillus cristatus]|uniref:Phosphoglycerate mutase family protein n=1 Tax=Aspergillus cristatus TaxID=573508 RepID=A0A1E3BRD6_ASPCR|nr:hypothetical protein SI65_01046 [Aspergillus cristatus]
MLFSPVLSLFSFLALTLFVSSSAIPNHHHHNRPTVYLLRHGEKPADRDNHKLNKDGYKRAECLRTVFGEDSPFDIGYILAPRVKKNGDHRRSFDTVHPLAKDLGLPVDTSCKRNHAKCVAKHIKRYDGEGDILVSWRHGRMAEIAERLGVEEPPEYPYHRFDLVWTIPYPYDKVTEVWSEECPGLDEKGNSSPLKIQA